MRDMVNCCGGDLALQIGEPQRGAEACGIEKHIQSAYYASSFGYEENNDLKELVKKYPRINDMVLKFVEFRDKVFCEISTQRKLQ